jgi:hypothetical protein
VTAAVLNADDQAEDDIFWTRSPGATYSAKSAYELQFRGRHNLPFSIDCLEGLGAVQMQILHLAPPSKLSMDL